MGLEVHRNLDRSTVVAYHLGGLFCRFRVVGEEVTSIVGRTVGAAYAILVSVFFFWQLALASYFSSIKLSLVERFIAQHTQEHFGKVVGDSLPNKLGWTNELHYPMNNFLAGDNVICHKRGEEF